MTFIEHSIKNIQVQTGFHIDAYQAGAEWQQEAMRDVVSRLLNQPDQCQAIADAQKALNKKQVIPRTANRQTGISRAYWKQVDIRRRSLKRAIRSFAKERALSPNEGASPAEGLSKLSRHFAFYANVLALVMRGISQCDLSMDDVCIMQEREYFFMRYRNRKSQELRRFMMLESVSESGVVRTDSMDIAMQELDFLLDMVEPEWHAWLMCANQLPEKQSSKVIARIENAQQKLGNTRSAIKEPEAGSSFRLCDPADVQNYLASFGRGNRVVSDKDVLTQVQQQGGMVSLAMVPAAYRDVLADFRVRFPNMVELADMIEDTLNLATLGGIDTPLQLASVPIILVGPPGTGKTMGLRYLAEKLGIAFKMICCAELTNSFDISGQSRGWGTGKPGMIARMLLHEQAANGIVVLDELDKCHVSEKNSPPAQALYTLLEHETAAHFKDEYFDFEMDASHINWMATANDYERIPEPLRDRAIKVCIAPPTIRQRLSIAGYLYQDLRLQHKSGWGRFFAPELDPAVAWMLASVEGTSIRGMKKNIMACLASVAGSSGAALEHGSLYVSEADAFKVIGQRPDGMSDSDPNGFLH